MIASSQSWVGRLASEAPDEEGENFGDNEIDRAPGQKQGVHLVNVETDVFGIDGRVQSQADEVLDEYRSDLDGGFIESPD
jgi:hypothetical protein